MLVEIVDRVDLGADEELLEVGVDHSSCLGCRRAALRRPRADFLLASGVEGLQAEQAVDLLDQAFESEDLAQPGGKLTHAVTQAPLPERSEKGEVLTHLSRGGPTLLGQFLGTDGIGPMLRKRFQ